MDYIKITEIKAVLDCTQIGRNKILHFMNNESSLPIDKVHDVTLLEKNYLNGGYDLFIGHWAHIKTVFIGKSE